MICRVPDAGEGTSVEILSVSREKIGSPSSTASPFCLSHPDRTPEVIDSPTAGILTSVLMFNGSAKGKRPVLPTLSADGRAKPWTPLPDLLPVAGLHTEAAVASDSPA